MCVTWLIHTCDVTHSCVWRDSFIRVTWLIHVCDVTHSCVTWLIHTCDVTHSCVCDVTHSWVTRRRTTWAETCVWRGPFKYVTWVMYVCNITHSYVRRDTFMCDTMAHDANWDVCVMWLVHMCDMTHLHTWHDSFTCVTWRIHTNDWDESCARQGALHSIKRDLYFGYRDTPLETVRYPPTIWYQGVPKWAQ